MDQQTYGIIGAALEVHNHLGPGFLEAAYKGALSIELAERGITFSAEAEIPVFYKGTRLKTSFRADFICHDSIIVELKAISKLGDLEMAQVLNYLRATGFSKGLLFNFGAKSLEQRRLIMSPGYFTNPINNINLCNPRLKPVPNRPGICGFVQGYQR
jgi:GxxExxY protein